MKTRSRTNNRGVALLIVLLVTALLIALIFEFSYATRISLNSAVNFRDGQRAYFLARAGVRAFIRYGGSLTKAIPQGEWGTVPFIGEEDTEVRIKWEDEAGKIMIADIKTNPRTQSIVDNLFGNKRIDTAVYDRMVDPASTISAMGLLTGLHKYMSDEDFKKVSGCLTVSPVNLSTNYININTASLDVLQALGLGQGAAEQIIESRKKNPFTNDTMPLSVKETMVPGLGRYAAVNFLNANQSAVYTVYSYATVGGYTKQIEAIINGSDILYWRAW